MERFEQKLDKIDERVDRLDVAMARVEEGVKSVYNLLEKHDAKATTALVKAQEVEKRVDDIPLTLLGKIRTVALWVTGVGGAVYFIVDKFFK